MSAAKKVAHPESQTVQPAGMTVEWHKIPKRDEDVPMTAFLIAADAQGKNATPARRKVTRYFEHTQWKRRLKWVHAITGSDIPFEPTHYANLPDGWVTQS